MGKKNYHQFVFHNLFNNFDDIKNNFEDDVFCNLNEFQII